MAEWFGGGLVVATLLVGFPVIAAAVGYAAWRGKPANFDRQTYWLGFVVLSSISAALFVFAQRMQADVRTGYYFVQIMCAEAGALMFGLAGGCLVAGFMYGRGKNGPRNLP